MNLHEYVARSAFKTPDAVAIRHKDVATTYRELDLLSNALAEKLSKLGVGYLDRVAIWAEKSPWVVAGMQAVLRLGAAYVPLDPLCPALRAQKILNDCRVRALMTTQNQIHGVSELNLDGLPCLFFDQSDEQAMPKFFSQVTAPIPSLGFSGNSPAYILYTSGSTGVPKGICLSHHNAVAFVDWAADMLNAQSSDRFSSHAPFHFDLSVLDLYAPFSRGASVALIPSSLAYSPRYLVDFILQEKITHWYSVPSALMLMMEHGNLLKEPLSFLRTVLFAGEPFPIKHLRRLKAHLPHARFLNLYGPTETNVCTFYEVDKIDDARIAPLPIGKPCCGNEGWIVRSDGSRVTSPDEEGELIIRGPTVMLGYWGKPPVEDGTYATGDIVKFSEEGDLLFLGRKDLQVKVKGYRIDLGEIEAALLEAPEILEAVVLVVGSDLNASLFACLVVRENGLPTLIELKQLCAKRLPPYMSIDRFKVFSEFPRTSTGKVDRKTLLERVLQPQKKAA